MFRRHRRGGAPSDRIRRIESWTAASVVPRLAPAESPKQGEDIALDKQHPALVPRLSETIRGSPGQLPCSRQASLSVRLCGESTTDYASGAMALLVRNRQNRARIWQDLGTPLEGCKGSVIFGSGLSGLGCPANEMGSTTSMRRGA